HHTLDARHTGIDAKRRRDFSGRASGDRRRAVAALWQARAIAAGGAGGFEHRRLIGFSAGIGTLCPRIRPHRRDDALPDASVAEHRSTAARPPHYRTWA